MRITGSYVFPRGMARIAMELQQPDMARAFVGSAVEITDQKPGRTDFVLKRGFGLIDVRVPGTVTLGKGTKPFHFSLMLEARHRLAGSVEIALSLELRRTEDGKTEILYEGPVKATGALRGVIAGYPRLFETQIENGFFRFETALARKMRDEAIARKAQEAAASAATSSSSD